MKKLVLFALLLVSSLAFAHSGGTDKDGCHNDRKAGTRHCHWVFLSPGDVLLCRCHCHGV